MDQGQKFFICNHCKNMIGMIDNRGVPIFCCGKKMEELVPNTEDAATEKHLPVVHTTDNGISVSVGSIEHPMGDEHYIAFVYVETQRGGQRKSIKDLNQPRIDFLLDDDKPLAVYAYCNLHGLWKTEIN